MFSLLLVTTSKCSKTRRLFSVVFCKSKRPYSSVLVKVFILPNGLVHMLEGATLSSRKKCDEEGTTSSRFLHILGLEINDKRKTGGHASTSTAPTFLLPSFLRSR